MESQNEKKRGCKTTLSSGGDPPTYWLKERMLEWEWEKVKHLTGKRKEIVKTATLSGLPQDGERHRAK